MNTTTPADKIDDICALAEAHTKNKELIDRLTADTEYTRTATDIDLPYWLLSLAVRIRSEGRLDPEASKKFVTTLFDSASTCNDFYSAKWSFARQIWRNQAEEMQESKSIAQSTAWISMRITAYCDGMLHKRFTQKDSNEVTQAIKRSAELALINMQPCSDSTYAQMCMKSIRGLSKCADDKRDYYVTAVSCAVEANSYKTKYHSAYARHHIAAAYWQDLGDLLIRNLNAA